ncbi:MAG TPA: AI-2E family transporter [Hyphomicrobium sp.]|nr:AI-2E family transporter [Hyphomicrobium sp.]
MPNQSPLSEAEYIRRVLITLGIVALAAAVYFLSDIFLLIFGSVLVAVVLHAIAGPVSRMTGWGHRLSLAVAGIGIVLLLTVVGFLFGAQIAGQLSTLASELPEAAARVSKTVPIASVPEIVKGSSVGNLIANAVSWGSTVFGAVATLIVVLIAGIYIAVDPAVYREGLLKLFPKGVQEQVSETVNDAGVSLRLWLGAQLMAMIIVGVLIGIGLAIIGAPSPLALGLIAGVLEFVPIIGPVIAAIPALLLASTQSFNMVLWVLGLFVVVQQIESNVIMPLVSGKAVNLSPAVGLFAVVALGILFGPLGLLLGYPVAIVIDVAVRRLYVRDTLGEHVEIASEKTAEPNGEQR